MQIRTILCAKNIVQALPLHVVHVRNHYVWRLAYYMQNFARTHLEGQNYFMSTQDQ